MDPWEAYRRHHLERLREAMARGEVDPPAVPLLDLLNAREDVVTTSSCSGRIVLLETTEEGRKRDTSFFRKWHRPVTVEEVLEAVESFEGRVLWFKMDPFIFHIATRDLPLALDIVGAARRAGIKIAGIQVIKPWRVNLEIRGIDAMAFPVYWGERVAEEKFLRVVVLVANRKMVKNQERLEALYRELAKLFSE